MICVMILEFGINFTRLAGACSILHHLPLALFFPVRMMFPALNPGV